ncbi:MAG: flagellar assembly protein FliX [Rhodospirillales bacterium]
MKVSKVGSEKSVSRPAGKKSAASSGADFIGELKKAAQAREPGEAQETAVAQPIESILSIQEVPDAADQRSRRMAKQYGEELLEQLERIRDGLLAGVIPLKQLTDLAQTMRQKRRKTDDPRLTAILGEIELRAEVEIAKLTRGK